MREVLSEHLATFIRSLPEKREYARDDLLVPALKVAEDADKGLAVYDAPFGWGNQEARVALIGVTPGFTQMQILYRVVRRHLLLGASPEDACRLAKYEASFGGTMRGNLVRMLDELGVPELLEVASTADLFGSSSHLLHTTSAVRYPTFLHGQNYTGSQPRLVRSAFLMRYVRDVLAPELSRLHAAVFVPLGKSVAEALELLETEQRIPAGRTLHGFPHPSGANGHRARQFEKGKPAMRRRFEEILCGGASAGAVQQQHAADGAARRR
ncbi:hypothetical protein XM38_033600 [Halomicronema hongdechloris C2206]|uniref:Uracil DNA glycosylase superfamily protein n=1 Tax=Halomicronema hongdechloris C2206 TaxID=1641165 RepID=A0A1Z3HGM2_9CYAN|nr:hypothetical protein [Halomicronema hongdechloris]ASC69405.1 uncharacterized protein XM38_003320 [Halomicronema hongdechloris C2206]ASC69414.1 hypothetical protein XM38_003410 [Halomicronema hongdechloris C2206]ASC72403.1 hypothetical protein XM38_033600 [Halomicronema hongdechloris C2206]